MIDKKLNGGTDSTTMVRKYLKKYSINIEGVSFYEIDILSQYNKKEKVFVEDYRNQDLFSFK